MKLNLIIATTLLALTTQAAPTSVKDFAGLQSEINVNNNGSSGGANLRLDADVTATAKLTDVKNNLTLTGKEATKTLDGANKYAGFS